MKRNFILTLTACLTAVVALTACSSDDGEGKTSAERLPLYLSSEVAMTRTENQNLQSNQLQNGTVVGAFVVNAGTTKCVTNGDHNVLTANGEGGFSYKKQLYFPVEGNVDIYTYAPYNENWTLEGTMSNKFTVATDQSTDEGYLASDLVRAVKTNQESTTNVVAMNFQHLLSKINIVIQNGVDNLSLAGATITICNIATSTSLNILSGKLGDTSEVADVTAAVFPKTTSVFNCSAIIVPQTLKAGDLIRVQLANGVKYAAKLGADMKVNGGSTYTFTVNIGEAGADMTLSSSLSEWTAGTNPVAMQANETVGVGDFLLNDGTFLTAADYATADDDTKAKMAAVIFSLTVSETDAAAGYGAYAMALTRYKNRTLVADADHPAKMTNGAGTWAQGLADLDGRTNTATMLASEYYAARTDEEKAACIFNMSGYTPAVTGSNVSGWFLPSFGQMVQILNTFGSAGITASLVEDGDNIGSSSPFYTSPTGGAAALVTNFKAKVPQAAGDLFAVGNIVYATSTENSSTSSAHRGKYWNFTTSGNADSNTWSLGKNTGRGTNGRSVIPVIAIKL